MLGAIIGDIVGSTYEFNGVKNEFLFLLNEKEGSVGSRIDRFINNFNTHFHQEGIQSYFDYRFVGFFLAANKPEKYIHIKYKELIHLAKNIGYDIKVNGSDGQRYEILHDFAEVVRSVLRNNVDFIKVHKKITSKFDYKDLSFSWGTTDFIFNTSRRIGIAVEKTVNIIIQHDKRIYENILEEAEDQLIDDDIVVSEGKRSTEELLSLINGFKPSKTPYIEKTGSYKVRRDSSIQKERIKNIENHSCQICGFAFEYISVDGRMRKFSHADHIQDKTDGGTEERDNLWVLCPNCHAKKTFGVITVDKINGRVFESEKEILLHHNKHLSWYKMCN